jgi:hypothetical protein
MPREIKVHQKYQYTTFLRLMHTTIVCLKAG